MNRQLRLKSIKDGKVLSDGSTGSFTLEREDGTEFTVEIDLPRSAATLLMQILQITADAGLERDATPPGGARVPTGVAQLQPSTIGLALSGPGHIAIGFGFGVLNLSMHVPTSELQRLSNLLAEQSRLASQEPKKAQ